MLPIEYCQTRSSFIATVLVLETSLVWRKQKWLQSRYCNLFFLFVFSLFQFFHYFNFFIWCVQAACKEVPPKLAPYTPGLAFIVVSKRINTRFFGMGHGPPSYQFFLVSQKVTQGTVSPTSFKVVEDSSSISPEIQQRLAYALTHLYYNWPVIFFVLLNEYLSIVICFFFFFFFNISFRVLCECLPQSSMPTNWPT